jgi:cysteine synthase A
VSSDAFSAEKLRTMTAFGAELTIVPSVDGKITPDLVPRMVEKASEFAAESGTYWTNQLHNADSLDGYRGIGDELLEQLDRPIDLFCASVGTAGLAMGVSSALSDGGSSARIVLLEPASTAIISGDPPGSHSVEGIGIGFWPPLLDRERFDESRPISESAGRAMARRLASEEGLLAGTSTGLNVAGAIDLAAELGTGKTVVTVAVDTGLKYLAGDLFAS